MVLSTTNIFFFFCHQDQNTAESTTAVEVLFSELRFNKLGLPSDNFPALLLSFPLELDL